jgi:hypothetical protein
MPARTKNSYTIPGVGTTVTGPKGGRKFIGKGPAPSGAKKVPEKTYDEVPTVTTSPSGKVTTSNFPSEQASKRAVRRQRATRQRTRRITRAVTQTRQHAAQRKRVASTSQKRVQQTEKAIKANRYEPNPAKAIVTAKPAAKPPTFKGKPTAGTPTRQELRRAASAGTLKVNKAGFATTPKVRKVGGELRRLQATARSSNAPLPGLSPSESRNANTVLRRGEKKRATRKEKLAAVETGLVEAPNFANPAGGDADSEGWRQERTSIYGTGPQGPRNVKASADRFFHEVRTDAGTSTAPTAGLLAQAAQGSAYPERYDARKPEAVAILKAHNKGSLRPAQRKKLAKVKAKAQDLGLKVGRGKAVGPAPKNVVTRFKAIKAVAKELEKMSVPYVYGGGHNGGMPDPAEGLDCSSSTVYLLNKAGVKIPNITSGEFGNYLPSGPGAVTVFYNPTHVFLKIGDKYFGTSAGDSGAGGLGYHPSPSSAYLSQYNVAHIPGLGRKQALQLGIKPAAISSAPGMTLSPSGTTATINPGAGTTKTGKPGFSKQPIRLTQRQKARRTFKRLEQAGIGAEQPAESTSPTLKALEAKYGA